MTGEGGESLLFEAETETSNSARFVIFDIPIRRTLQETKLIKKCVPCRVIVKSEPTEPKSIDRSPNIVQEIENTEESSIKIETVDESDNGEDDESADVVDSEPIPLAQSYPIGTENILARSALLSGTATTAPISLNASTSGSDNKYCNVCDIKFKYLNSYIAHKKSYCRNIPNELDMGAVSSNQATSVIATTCSSPNQTSVVT